MTLPNLALVVSLSAFVALFIAIGWMQLAVKRRLKKHFANNPNIPNVTFNPLDHSASRTLSFLKFIVRKQYSNLSDTKLTRDCNALRVLYICYLVAFVWVAFAVLMRP